MTRARPAWLIPAWVVTATLALGVRVWNALQGEMMWGYDAWGHVAYMLFIDLHHAFPWADQGWSYYQPPLHYVLGAGLAQLGNGEILVRGLSFVATAASLGTATLAALLARAVSPERPGLALIAFSAVAFLPVQIYMSNMPGNELAVSFFNSAAVASFVWNERRERPRRSGDVITGVLLALALLTKHTGLVAVASIGASLLLGAILSGDLAGEIRRLLPRGLILAGCMLVIAGPHYGNNLSAYGKLIPTNRDYPLVRQVEGGQSPGKRSIADYLRLSPAMFDNANVRAPHMLHSIWGTTYMSAWAEIHRESDRGRALEAELVKRPSTTALGLLGLIPTLLALIGVGMALVDVLQGRRRWLYLPLLTLSTVMLSIYAYFLWQVPIWAAVKAAYCLSLSLPFAAFLLRGLEGMESMARARNLPRAADVGLVGSLGVVAIAAAVVSTAGAVLPLRRDAPAMGAVHFHFNELEAARTVYAPYLEAASYKAAWLENLAAVELAQGNAARALTLHERAEVLAAHARLADPYRSGRIAVARALTGDLEAARTGFDAILEDSEGAAAGRAEAHANRGAIRAALGDITGAQADLRAALAEEAALSPAIHNLARLHAEGAIPACESPRAYPYGLGTGEVLEWAIGRRPLLVLMDDDKLVLARPDFYRGACKRLSSIAKPANG